MCLVLCLLVVGQGYKSNCQNKNKKEKLLLSSLDKNILFKQL